MTPMNCFWKESATLVSEQPQWSVLSCVELVLTMLNHYGVITNTVCGNKITWEGCVWNADHHLWGFHICYSCMGPTSQHCAEHGGSCCNGCDGDEEEDDDPVVINAPHQFQPTGSTQMPHGFVHTAYGIVNTRFPFVYSGLRNNEADIFTVSPPLLHDLRSVPGCLFSRIHVRQYCNVQQSVSLSGWWAVPLGAVNTVCSTDTAYFAFSGALCLIGDLALTNRREAVIDTDASRSFVLGVGKRGISPFISYAGSVFLKPSAVG